jgi:hypothetical protein
MLLDRKFFMTVVQLRKAVHGNRLLIERCDPGMRFDCGRGHQGG